MVEGWVKTFLRINQLRVLNFIVGSLTLSVARTRVHAVVRFA